MNLSLLPMNEKYGFDFETSQALNTIYKWEPAHNIAWLARGMRHGVKSEEDEAVISDEGEVLIAPEDPVKASGERDSNLSLASTNCFSEAVQESLKDDKETIEFFNRMSQVSLLSTGGPAERSSNPQHEAKAWIEQFNRFSLSTTSKE